ncbi:hypothetical protein M011DRAFT_465914 [Sporormia fimetaria CBS 119925]|uniref:UAS domain-containing protein n=1 Tax=Sporormia fimetaria CBS 119925 TaxID=1340428 RepID=A0A6A6VI17_9PLEO|nr:hypothetical protein M011DRAFT_465914 [Sporormia fimetaria CBS 119925]
MEENENVLNFVAITSADPEKAAQYLQLTDNNLEQAIQLFFDSPNLDIGGSSTTAQPAQHGGSINPISIVDSDDEMMGTESRSARPGQGSVEDDEAMARRLQEEMYGGADRQDEVRAPMARTTETLVGPGAYDEDDVDAMVHEQLARRTAARGRARAGIFNQRGSSSSVWDDSSDANAQRQELAAATGGASEQNAKSNRLAQMYRPPFELMYQGSWDDARDRGKEQEKWLLVNIQDSSIFDCQVLNRDIWKNESIRDTVKENFVFMQYSKDDPRGGQYMNYYFQARDSPDAYPHIAVVDPRTGEQVKVWSGHPVPTPIEFHADLHEFLDRYSLKANAKNPVAMRKPEKKKVDVNRMTEEEMLEMALQNSLENGKGAKDDDPDALTRQEPTSSSADKGKAKMDSAPPSPQDTPATEPEPASTSPFASISDSHIHTEPPASADPKAVTRIKFTSSAGQKVRKFYVHDTVRTLYEWIKAGGWEGKEGLEFELTSMRRNLIDSLDQTVEEAGLKGSVVNVEFME